MKVQEECSRRYGGAFSAVARLLVHRSPDSHSE